MSFCHNCITRSVLARTKVPLVVLMLGHAAPAVSGEFACPICGTFAAHVTYGAGDVPFSVAIGDLDGVIGPDLAVANNGTPDAVSVLLNQGDGTFAAHVTYGAGDSPQSVAIGDLDGDLDLDLAVANTFSDDVSVLLNQGDGTFAAVVSYTAGD